MPVIWDPGAGLPGWLGIESAHSSGARGDFGRRGLVPDGFRNVRKSGPPVLVIRAGPVIATLVVELRPSDRRNFRHVRRKVGRETLGRDHHAKGVTARPTSVPAPGQPGDPLRVRLLRERLVTGKGRRRIVCVAARGKAERDDRCQILIDGIQHRIQRVLRIHKQHGGVSRYS